MIHVLFVCLGNICRSPMAEAIFAHQVQQAGLSQQLQADSAGTANYHTGGRPDHRTLKILARHGIQTAHRARQVSRSDFQTFDYILAMDHHNLENLQRMQASLAQRPEGVKARLELMGAYELEQPVLREVPDPYYGELDDFEQVYQMLAPACARLLQEIQAQER